ncbi:protein PIH1D3 isoform X2 [Ictalurus furcatus]|uniref:protein PIH1D3 isoform X2 n=1 Tax=Ictalurus furcatus TaxID=66913 RepID=UPI002350219F|nr:protein PIH1D3 isoform X2 [Ictalurus furcatus]
MEELSSLQNLQALSDLLSLPAGEESDSEDCKNVNSIAKMGPGHIGAPSFAPRQDKNAVNSAYVKNTKDIWDVEEVTEGTHFDDLADPRPQPERRLREPILCRSQKHPPMACCRGRSKNHPPPSSPLSLSLPPSLSLPFPRSNPLSLLLSLSTSFAVKNYKHIPSIQKSHTRTKTHTHAHSNTCALTYGHTFLFIPVTQCTFPLLKSFFCCFKTT